MVRDDDDVMGTGKRRVSGLFFFVVVLFSCSLTKTVASGPEAETGDRPEVEFLRRILVSVVRDAMRDQDIRCESRSERDFRIRMEGEAIRIGRTLQGEEEEEEEEEEGEDRGMATKMGEEGVDAGGKFSSPRGGRTAAEVKRSKEEVIRDQQLKTLFRWG